MKVARRVWSGTPVLSSQHSKLSQEPLKHGKAKKFLWSATDESLAMFESKSHIIAQVILGVSAEVILVQRWIQLLCLQVSDEVSARRRRLTILQSHSVPSTHPLPKPPSQVCRIRGKPLPLFGCALPEQPRALYCARYGIQCGNFFILLNVTFC